MPNTHNLNSSPRQGFVALKAFFAITTHWGCSAEQQACLLGKPKAFARYQRLNSEGIQLPRDTLERISYLLGIHKALSIIFSADLQRAYAWVSKPNLAPPFNGKSALAYMLQGRVLDLADVRRFLDGLGDQAIANNQLATEGVPKTAISGPTHH